MTSKKGGCLSRRSLLILLMGLLLSPACRSDEDIPPPPPEDDKPAIAKPVVRPVEIDPRHSITIKADKMISIPNVVLVLQNSAAKNDSYGITLTTSRTSVDGSRMIFGALESGPSVDAVLKENLHFASGPTLDPVGNGVFMTTAVYQPKFAGVKLTSVNGDEAAGTISGEFYRFSVLAPTARPTVVKAEGAFMATVIRK